MILVRICRTCGSFLEVRCGRQRGAGREFRNVSRPQMKARLVLGWPRKSGERTRKRLPPRMKARSYSRRTRKSAERARKRFMTWMSRFQASDLGRCPQCQQLFRIPFDRRWNCRTSRDGIPDPNFVKDPLDIPWDRDRGGACDARNCPGSFGAQSAGHPRSFRKPGCLPTDPTPESFQVVVYGNPQAL